MRRVRIFLNSIIESKNKTLLAFCFCFIFACVIFSILEISRELLFNFYIAIFILLFLAIIFWERKIWRFLFLAILFFIFGICRVLFTLPQINENHISFYNGQKVILEGVVSNEPTKKFGYKEYELDVFDLSDSVDIKRLVKGKVLVRAPAYPEFFYGDKLQIKCTLKKPVISGNFNYPKFLALKNIYSTCFVEEIILLDKKQGNKILSMLFLFKSRINDLTQKLWSEPQSTLVAGILYGERSGFDANLKNNFNRAGITHIVAVSGYNITIIVWVLLSLLIFTGLYRQQAFWVCLVLVFLFVIFTGLSASAVRAGLMGVLVLLAQYLGRKSQVFLLLVYAATLICIFNPLTLVWDIGFQLSFLATIGLIYLSPILENKVKLLPLSKSAFFKKETIIKTGLILKELLLPTLSATIFTFPLISYSFGYFSIFSIFSNLLILWLIPFLMFGGFLSILLATVFFPLGQVLAWITNIGLSYVIMVGDRIGGWGFSAVNWQIPLWLVIIIYIFLISKVKTQRSKL